MPRRIAENTLNASTLDILNVIWTNASLAYQQEVPQITDIKDIPKVGEILYGHPALANQFINALINRIALVRVRSAVFNNPYAPLKKGYLQFGETVEDVFVEIAKVRRFDATKAVEREFRQTLPEVHSAFYTMNWRVQYPITVREDELRTAFLSADGVQDMIARIIDSVYQAAEYDEFLLFKYLIIKNVAHGHFYPVAIDAADKDDAAIQFRAVSNLLNFRSSEYNVAGVSTVTPRDDQFIFMDARYNAKFDVTTLSAAFNMDKANFMGNMLLIDNFTKFDNERFKEIAAESDMIDEVTQEELALMENVKAVVVDREWFQIYDNLDKFTEQYAASAMYWNYFYNVFKTIAYSPFSNAVVFLDSTAETALPASVTVEVASKDVAENGTVLTLQLAADGATAVPTSITFVQSTAANDAGVGIQPYGAVLVPPNAPAIALTAVLGGVEYQSAAGAVTSALEVGATVALNKVATPTNRLAEKAPAKTAK